MPRLKQDLGAKHQTFKAAQIKARYQSWAKLTSDPDILQTVKGVKIQFESNPDTTAQSRQRQFTAEINKAVDDEIQKLLKKEVIAESAFEPGQVISPIFVRPKKDGSYRMILNLKALNERVEYKQFQMETLQTALDMVTKGAWFTSVDLRDAFYTLPISTDCRRYLKFCWREKLYCFQAAAMGLGPIPRILTKLTKPALAHLRNLGHAITSFIDDSLLVGETQSETVAATIDTIKTFDSLGFLVHDD